jgi:hypothetical protein
MTVTPRAHGVRRRLAAEPGTSPPKEFGRDHEEATDEGPWPDQLLPGVAGLPLLIRAAQSGDGARLQCVRRRFERLNGRLLDTYVTPCIEAGAVLVGPEREDGPSPGRHLYVWIDRRDLVAEVREFSDALWRALWLARRTEGTTDRLVPQGARTLVADMLYTVVTALLGALDSLAQGETVTDTDRRRLRAMAANADAELDRLDDHLDREAIRGTFRSYLWGLPIGAAGLAVPVLVVLRIGGLDPLQWLLVLTIVAGGVGAVTSVMVRITRGQRLSVDTAQGRLVTLLAGAFRPLVGAVFGVALYVLVVAEFVPIELPAQREHFFAALAFLAGFSERWAQDTIIRSAPVAPSPATKRDPRAPHRAVNDTDPD